MAAAYQPTDVDTQVEMERRRRQEAARAAATRELATRVAANRAAYPGLKPGDALATAQAGAGPDSPVTAEVATRRVKRKSRGFGLHSLGAIVTAPVRLAGKAVVETADAVSNVADFVTPEGVENVIGSGLGVAKTAAKPIVRGAGMALSAPYEEVQGLVRNVASSVHGAAAGALTGGAIGGAAGTFVPVVGNVVGALGGAVVGGVAGAIADPKIEGKAYWGPQSNLGVAVQKKVQGEGFGDVGSGFLVGRESEVFTEQAERARGAASIGGKGLTPGRLIATAVAEPGTAAHNALSGALDMTALLRLDPAIAVLGGLGKSRAAASSLAPAVKEVGLSGLLTGTRRTVSVDRIAEWKASGDGALFAKAVADEPDAYKLWVRSGRRFDVDDAVRMADARTPDEVWAVLDPRLGINYQERLGLARVPFENPVVRRVRDSRLLGDVPARSFDPTDANATASTVENWIRNANIRDPEVIGRHMNAHMRAANSGERFDALKATASLVEDVIVDNLTRGMRGLGRSAARPATEADRSMARQLTTLFANHEADFTRYNVDDLAENVWFPGVKVNGAGKPLPSPHLLAEGLASKVHLPDHRAIRRATSRYYNLLTNRHDEVRVSHYTLDFIQTKLWKRSVLVRPAYTLRVVGEEQVRAAGAGWSSFANHPLQALGIVVSDTSRVGKLLGKAGVGTGREAIDFKGALFAEQARLAPRLTEFERAQYAGRPTDIGARARRVIGSDRVMYDKGHERYAAGLGDQLMFHRIDPIAQRVVAGGLREGDRSPGGLSGIDGIKDWFWAGSGRGLRDDVVAQSWAPAGTAPATRALSDEYIDSVVQRWQRLAGSDSDLVDAVMTGAFRGVPLRAGDKLNPAAVKALADAGVGPAQVHGARVLTERFAEAKRADHIFDGAFSFLMARPSNYLSRSSVFRQDYWDQGRKLIGLMEPKAQEALLRAAKEAKLPQAQLDELARLKASRSGALTLDEADLVAKGHALEHTRDLLYDLSQRGQLFDVTRMIFPFGEAFAEVMTRWSRLVVANPKIPRRAQTVVEGARGAGFFKPGPNGEEMYAFPGSERLAEALMGIPVPLLGSVKGLNMIGGLVPGVAPVVQIFANAWLPDRPDWDWAREALLPFGGGETEGGLFEALLPAWVQKFRTAGLIPGVAPSPEQVRLWNNTVFDMAAYLVSTGEYSISTPDEIARVEQAAKSKAKALYVLRGFAQSFTPSAPSPQMVALDKDGKVMLAIKLTEEYAKLSDEDYDTATAKFLDKYGTEALLFMQGGSEGGAPPLANLAEWAREHPDQVSKHREVYGYFGPQGGEFDFDFYHRQLRSGERKPLSVTEAIERANHRVAAMEYRQARAKLDGRTDEAGKAWLGEVKADLLSRYPGWSPEPKDPGRNRRTIAAFEAAAKDPVLAATPAGKAIGIYLSKRQMAIEAARQIAVRGKNLSGFQQAKAARHLRDWLRATAADLIATHPDFAPAWEQVFEREMASDAETAEEAA